MKALLLLPAVALAVTCLSCKQEAKSPPAATATATNATRSFPTRGLVREIAEDRKTIVVRHEEIPGYMPKMTMELTVKDPAELAAITEGDIITFDLVVDDETHHIARIQRVGRDGSAQTNTAEPKQSHLSDLGPGDAMPEVALVDENGKQIKLSDFQGKAVAFTFIFSRCPLPDYCPRMNKHFARARELLQKEKTTSDWQFLSISFDPEFDTPPVLKRYADNYRGGSADRWLFAAIAPDVLSSVAPQLDFRFSREGGSFSHNLRTVVLDTKGRIYKQLDNNLWSPEELAKAMVEAANAQ